MLIHTGSGNHSKSPQTLHLIQNIPIKEELISLANITILIVILLTVSLKLLPIQNSKMRNSINMGTALYDIGGHNKSVLFNYTYNHNVQNKL